MTDRIHVGTAGWSIPRSSALDFDAAGTHLQRYACRLSCAEINSSFYRSHAIGTYARWAASTGPGFRFAVKVPRLITHELKLRRGRRPFLQFLHETSGLGSRRGPLLVQLPPSFEFERRLAAAFFAMVRAHYEGPLVCEPRHPTWFSPRANTLMIDHHVARVAADPPPVPDALSPGGWSGLAYFRLHGAPRMYWSRYEWRQLERLAAQMLNIPREADVWCVFDNTASGAAARNACELSRLIASGRDGAVVANQGA
jgi:uncharacterized protein YecE (DUF72 family)